MKKTILILIVLIIGSQSTIIAQNRNTDNFSGDKYYAQKIAFITDAMQLTPDESTAFWPLYNEGNQKKKEMLKEMRVYRRDMMANDSITEEQALDALKFYQQHMQKMSKLNTEYQNKYLKVVSAKKVLLLLKAEKDFRRSMLKNLGNKKGKKRYQK